MGIKKEEFGVTKKKESVSLYTIQNQNGMEAKLLDYGATLQSLLLPMENGEKMDVVLGFDQIEAYEVNDPNFGSTIGRNGNRIGKGVFSLNGKTYQLDKNDGNNNLHGGFDGYHKRMWKVREFPQENRIEFSILSPDGDQGFPGNVEVRVSYRLTEEDGLEISYFAKPDADTILNMTNHSYFNLEGQDSQSVLEQKVWIDADRVTATDAELIPTGVILNVEGTPLDFRKEKAIGKDIFADYEPLLLGHGYDHNWILNHQGSFRKVASLHSDKTGKTMDVLTDLPGMQMYTANFLDGSLIGKGGVPYRQRSGVCFETQYYPDAPNHADFPSTVVRAGETYETVTIYKFYS
jgi:aldose 1-epimerase